MFDFVREQKWITRIFLALICVPFALFGIDWYQRGAGGGDAVATVEGEKISVFEFNRRLQEIQDNLRRVYGPAAQGLLVDSPQFREQLVEELIAEKLVALYLSRRHLWLGDAELQQTIASMPDFQVEGSFSKDRYQQLLKASGRPALQFQEEVRREASVARLRQALSEAAISSAALAKQLASYGAEAREVSEWSLSIEPFLKQVKLATDAVEAYYQANRKEFEIPEQVRAEYVVLNREMVAARMTPTADQLRKLYDETMAPRFRQRAEARKKAEALLAEIRKAPGKFADFAKQHSDDPGSKEKGGDLGFNPKGAMVKPFDDAVFKLKPNEVSGLVETEFGFHIIRLEEVRVGQESKGEERRASHILINAPAEAKDFEAARPDLERELRLQQAQTEFPKMVDSFVSEADQVLDSLKPLADKFKLEVQTSDWMARSGPDKTGVLGHQRVVAALFDGEALKAKRSTEAIEVAPGVLVVARPIEHRAAGVRSLDEARAEIEKKLLRQEAEALARAEGEAKLALLRKGEDAGIKWGAAKVVVREKAPESIGPEAARAVFRADASKPPAYVGTTDASGGYRVFRITKVSPGEAVDEKRIAEVREALARQRGEEQMRALIDVLRNRATVEVFRENLDRKGG